jgi:hypothetical protein
VDEKVEHRVSLCRGCTIMWSAFDEFRNRVGQAVACSSFMSLTERMDLSVSFASEGSVGAGRVRAISRSFDRGAVDSGEL